MRRAGPGGVPHRMALLRAALVLGLALVGVRSLHLALLDSRIAERAADQGTATFTVAGERGRIYDRFGAELAVSTLAPSVHARPAAVRDPEETARVLARVLRRPRASLEARLRHPGPFVYLARWVDPETAARIRELALPGIGVTPEPRRSYPYGELAGQVLGFSNIDGQGVRGVERAEDRWLRGRRLRVPVERAGDGLFLWDSELDSAAHAGGDLRLTLSAVLQAEAEAALDGAVRATGARGGVVVVLEPGTGELLAVAESPRFDPNRFREVPYAETRARAFLDAFEAGSAMKVFAVAAALERGVLREGEQLDCSPGSLVVGGRAIRDSSEHDVLAVTDVIRVSSNIGAVRIASRLGPRAHFEMLARFGFGRATGSGFPEESAGLMRPWQQWRPIDHATIAYGQGINVTPVQLAAATAALANDGVLVPPRLVRARRLRDGRWTAEGPRPGRRVVRPEVARAVLAMMERVVEDGTGRRAALPGVRVAGKTGTAQVLDPRTGRYTRRYDAWFVGVVPADAPELVIAVLVEEPRHPHTGGAVAAPVFAEVARGELLRRGLLAGPATAAATATRRRGGAG